MLRDIINTLFGDIYGLALAGITLLISIYIYRRMTAPRLPPSPGLVLPLLGNYFALRSTSKVSLCEQLREWGKEYGNLITIHLGPLPFVVLNDYEITKEAFVNQANTYAGRPYSYSSYLFTEGNNDIALTDFGPQWATHRRLAMAAMRRFADKSRVAELVCESTTDVCEMMIKEQHEEGKVKEIENKIYLLIYNVIASIVFGKRFKPDDKDFISLTKDITEMNLIFATGIMADWLPALWWVPTPAKSKLMKCMKTIFEYFDKNIKEHESSLDEDNPRDITDAVLVERAVMQREGKEDVSFFKDVHVRQTLEDVFFAGTDTTCFTIIWTLLYLIRYPKEQEKSRLEIEANVGDRMITPDDRSKLPYTEAFLLEVMRMRPIAPLSIPHTPTTNNATLKGYDIPKGVNVVPNVWACHYDEKYWSKPNDFLPERFIDGDGKVQGKPDSFIPFSLGRRACAGEQLARLDTFLILATLVQRMQFLPVSDENLPSLDPNPELGAFACAHREFEMKLEER